MSDPVFDKYIASMRACIDSYGAQNTVHALAEAFSLESDDITNESDRQKKYLSTVSEKLEEVYYQMSTL